ncbi:MAG TPA: response regulator [Anaerolineae bacterium]|nr:response regulator [Anaerolineae bacterium]HQK15103.1 response regulator [Anaerolineae bacterium]
MARVLVIDDNIDMLSMLKLILERQGHHEVIACSNGQEGLQKAFEQMPAVALVDVMMPGMSGYDVVKKLRADERTQNMGIIILTARGQSVDRAAALAAGADDHMSKPADVETLLKRVNELVERGASKAQKSEVLVVPVLSLKGGVGVTTVAINLAGVLQQVAPTLLLDLAPACGQCAFFLGIRPEQHWGQYVENPKTSAASLVQQHTTGLKVLLAPPIPAQFGWPNKDRVEMLLAQLKAVTRFIVVDMPPLFDETVRAVLGQAHRIVLITGDDAPSLQVTRITLQALNEWKDRLILIRNATAVGPRPPADALQKALRVPLAVDIPYDPNQLPAVAKGLLLASVQPKSALTVGVKRLAQIAIAR